MKREQIDTILHDKLYNMEPETGVPSWERFEPRLKRKTTTTRYLPYAALISAAAAAIVLIVVLTHSPQSYAPAPVVEPHTAQVDPTIVAPEDDNTPAVTTPRTRARTVDECRINEPVPKPLDPIPIPPERTPAPDPADPQPTQGPQQPQKADNWERVNWRSSLEITAERERKNRKISLLAYSNIPSANRGINGITNNAIVQNPMSQKVENGQDIINFKDSDMTHKIPITFGISVSIPLNDKFAIESGLTYTYLESTAEINRGFRYKYTQKVEYLGLPISATYKFIDTRIADIYGSVGVMGEVALSAKGKAEVFDLFHSESENNSIATSGVQFSANAAVGVNMHVTKNIGIYFEPGISNYLKNSNQPSTARSQSAFQLNMRAGFKIQL